MTLLLAPLSLATFFTPLASATTGFDPSAPAAVYNGAETYTEDGTIRLWAEIARYDDPDRTLFGPVAYNDSTAWPDNDFYSPWIAACFGTTTPPSSSFLFHVGPDVALATGTPILFVPGAGDNASRGFITMATHMDYAARPVFAITFPHVHGDVYQQAELIADAVAVVQARTGAAKVDIVTHSKGGIATAVYLSNATGTEWDGGAYEAVGTAYADNVRKAVFIATPLAGIDTSFRWPSGNTLALDADTAFSPSSWGTYYPYTIATWWTSTDLSDQDFLPDGADLFPGHRQLLARQPYPLPAELPSLGLYGIQQDWYTTYEGGPGLMSESDGIDAAIEAGGNLLDHLAAAGIDPDVKVYLLAGENPLMPNGAQWLWAETFGEVWTQLAMDTAEVWSQIIAALVGDSLLPAGVTQDEVQGIVNGDLVLGEITGASDGLVFVSSATAGDRLTARGAVVVESKVVNLSHLDLLYASPITGALLIEDSTTAPSKAWEAALGARYTEADTIGWVEIVLADESNPDTGGDTAGDTGDDTGSDTGGDTGGDDTGLDTAGDSGDTGTGGDETGAIKEDEAQALGCGSCATGGAGAPGVAALLLAAGLVRRRRG